MVMEEAEENEFKHIHKDYRHHALADDHSRIQFLREPLWINYPKTVEIIELLQRLLDQPKKPRMQSLLLIGESNIGKTSLIQQFITNNKDYSEEDDFEESHLIKPVIYAQFPASGDEKGLYIAIIEQFWTPFRATESAVRLRHQAIHLLRECQVKMIILDEVHNLLGSTAAKQRILMNVLKNLSNDLLIPIVGVGTKDAAMILHSDPQHASRFDVVNLPRWELDKVFLALLLSFEKKLPLRKPSMLKSREKATALFAICRGNLGDLHRLLIECAICAIKEETEEITLDIINKHNWLKLTDGIRNRKS